MLGSKGIPFLVLLQDEYLAALLILDNYPWHDCLCIIHKLGLCLKDILPSHVSFYTKDTKFQIFFLVLLVFVFLLTYQVVIPMCS